MLSKLLFDSHSLLDLLDTYRDRTLAGHRLVEASEKLKAAQAEVEASQAEMTRLNRKIHEMQMAAVARAQGAA